MTRKNQTLIGHWPLKADGKDLSGHNLDGVSHAVRFEKSAAVFNGNDSWLEVKPSKKLALGKNPFSISVWVDTEKELDGAIGDIVGQFDPVRRRGFNLLVNHVTGACHSQANFRNLQFGIDDGTEPKRVLDCGRLGTSNHVSALAVHAGQLYAGTFEFCKHEAGHVWRWAGGKDWVDCGCPDRSNIVGSLASYDGALYATTSCGESLYSLGISSPNTAPGGWLYRFEPAKNKWINCGKPSPEQTVGCLAVYKGKLYATSSAPNEFYRYEGDGKWTVLAGPGQLVMSLGVYHGQLYVTSNYRTPDQHRLFRYDDERNVWIGCGKHKEISQVYAQAIHGGRLYIATYPYGKVYRYDGDEILTDAGHMGRDKLAGEIPSEHRFWEPDNAWQKPVFENCVIHPKEQEIQSMAVYNGKLYAGTIPSAEVYRYDGGKDWKLIGCADGTTSAYLRRAWSMAIYQGKLFVGSLPAGYVFGFEAGKMVTHDRELEPGWRHIAAVRNAAALELYVDGLRVAATDLPTSQVFDLSASAPLRIGFGAHDYFRGQMADLRLYQPALSASDVGALFQRGRGS